MGKWYRRSGLIFSEPGPRRWAFFFGLSAQRLTSDSRAAAGLEIASCRGINQSLASASHPG